MCIICANVKLGTVNTGVILDTREHGPCSRSVIVTRAILGVRQVENNYAVINNSGPPLSTAAWSRVSKNDTRVHGPWTRVVVYRPLAWLLKKLWMVFSWKFVGRDMPVWLYQDTSVIKFHENPSTILRVILQTEKQNTEWMTNKPNRLHCLFPPSYLYSYLCSFV